MDAIKAIRGMNDILPTESGLWQYIETILRNVIQSFGYKEIRTPIVEKTELFKRSIGELTDIVEKEMYTFLDRSEESLTLRPEGTAGCVRAGIEHGLFYNQVQRLWYMGPYFRYERPQKGRYRQFYQCGAEVFGLEGPDIDAELILLSKTILDELGLKQFATLQINSLGSSNARAHYRDVLVQYLKEHQDQLDEDSLRRLAANPLRILDSKNPAMKELILNAPQLIQYLDDESKHHFDKLQKYLHDLNIDFSINPNLVRGLDYYTKTVFEWVTDELGAQGTVCAGGRYDALIEQLGGNKTPALGFALGLERAYLLLQQLQKSLNDQVQIYFIVDREDAYVHALKCAATLRAHFLNSRIIVHAGLGNFKNQFKRADKSGAKMAFILGEQELKEMKIAIKFLREDKPQVTISENQLIQYLIENKLMN